MEKICTTAGWMRFTSSSRRTLSSFRVSFGEGCTGGCGGAGAGCDAFGCGAEAGVCAGRALTQTSAAIESNDHCLITLFSPNDADLCHSMKIQSFASHRASTSDHKHDRNFRLDPRSALAYAWNMATAHIIEPAASQVGLLHRISSIVSSELSLDEMLGEIIGLTAQVTIAMLAWFT